MIRVLCILVFLAILAALVRSNNAAKVQHAGHEELHVQIMKEIIEAKAGYGDFLVCGGALYTVRVSDAEMLRVASSAAPLGETFRKSYQEVAYEHCSVVKYDDERWKSLAKRAFLGVQ